AVEMLDAQVLLDPLEEQLHLPALLVKRRDGGRRQHEIVGQKHEPLAGFRIAETNAPQIPGIVLPGVKPVERGWGRLAAGCGRGGDACAATTRPWTMRICATWRGAFRDGCMHSAWARPFHSSRRHRVNESTNWRNRICPTIRNFADCFW